MIKGGRVAGFAKSDVFALVPHGRELKVPWVANVKLLSVDVFDLIGDTMSRQVGVLARDFKEQIKHREACAQATSSQVGANYDYPL